MGGLYYPWNTAGKNAKYSIRLTIEDTGGTRYESSPIVLMLDNKRLEKSLKVDTVLVCADIIIGDKVTGKITGTDEHFYSYRLWYESSLASGLILAVRKYTGVSDTGDVNVPFTWDTTGLPPCGYRIILRVWNRTIANNHCGWGEPGYGWRELDQQYFCLKAAVELYLIMAKTGQLPEELPDDLPRDPYTGQNFLYKKNEDGFSLGCRSDVFKRGKERFIFKALKKSHKEEIKGN